MNIEVVGDGPESIVFIHGLGGNSEFFRPLIATAKLDSAHKCVLFDLEGHGLSPTKASSTITIDSYAADLANIFTSSKFELQTSTIVAHSMGCLVAMAFALKNPLLVKKLILLGPLSWPLPAPALEGQKQRAAAVLAKGLHVLADTVVHAGTSRNTKLAKPVALATVRASLMGTSPVGYAKGCIALGDASFDHHWRGR